MVSVGSITVIATSIPEGAGLLGFLGVATAGAYKGGRVEWLVENYSAATTPTFVQFHGGVVGSAASYVCIGSGGWKSYSEVERIRVQAEGGNLTAGTIYVYGIKHEGDTAYAGTWLDALFTRPSDEMAHVDDREFSDTISGTAGSH
jgi:hypothetical protein